MSDQKKNINDTEQTSLGEKFAKAVVFCRNNARYIAAAGLFIVLVIVLTKCSGNNDKPVNSNGTEVTAVRSGQSGATDEYAKDAIPEINQLITDYYKAYAKGDGEKLATLAEPISETEKSYISVFSQYVKKYDNISCYTKKGLDDKSYIVSVYLEVKFKNVPTKAPGLETFYVKTREDGSLYIDNVYGQFNSEMSEFETDVTVSDLLDTFATQEDVVALQTEVQSKYEAALASDESLKTMVETTIPDAITVWASDQAAAAKKAEDEKKAQEEAAQKAAEEEAAKKAEEEKKAQELAAAVTVYATTKVNVRAEASETAELLGQLEEGAQTTRLEDKDGWSRISYTDGVEGYVKSEYLSTEAATDSTDEAPAENTDDTTQEADANGFAEGDVITIPESINVRESASQDSDKIATAFAGETVTVIMSYADGWTKVTYGDKTGYIKTELLQ